MPKYYLEIALDGGFRTVDEEREFGGTMRALAEKVVSDYIEDRGLTRTVRLRYVTADKILPDDDVDRDEKLRRLRERRQASE